MKTSQKEHNYKTMTLNIYWSFDKTNYKTLREFNKAVSDHQIRINKELGDHIFFEGLDDEPSVIDDVPTYYIACGS